MNATELYKAGRLGEAIDAQVQEVKASPPTRRSGCSSSSCSRSPATSTAPAGRSTRSSTTTPTSSRAPTATAQLIDCRAGPPQALRARACRRRSSASRPNTCGSGSRRSIGSASRRTPRPPSCSPGPTRPTPAVRGELNGKPFESLRDADDLLRRRPGGHGPRPLLLGRASSRSGCVAMNPPRFPRDLLYIPARLELAGESGDVFLPGLYPGRTRRPTTRSGSAA